MSQDPQVQQVKDANDIATIIGERVTLKPGGRSLKGLCPFHSEKSPSFYVTPEMQIYKCFGCGESGDVFTFLEKFEGMGFAESLEYLAKRAGITLTQSFKTPKDQIQDNQLAILDLASQYYHYLLTKHPIGQTARDYLKTRQVNSSSLTDFDLGYAPNSWSALTDYLTQKKKYSLVDVEAVGLIIKSQRSTNYYDRFRGRLIFPLKDARGNIVGFSGRVLDPTVKQAKYINSPETDLYHKAKLLFGFTQARGAIRKKDRVVIVEGELDVISSHQINVKEVVAVKGSALTNDQILQVKRLTKNIILSLDADDAGQEAIKRAITLCEQHELNLRIINLSEGKDPDELIKTDPSLWKSAIKQAKSVYQFYLDYALAKFTATTGEGQKAITQFLVPIYAQIQNAVEQAYYINKLAVALETTQLVILSEINKFNRKPTTSSKAVSPSDSSISSAKPISLDRRHRLERYLLTLILHLQSDSIPVLMSLKPQQFTHTYLKLLVDQLQTLSNQNPATPLNQITAFLPPEKTALIQQLYTQDQKLLEVTQSEINKYFSQALAELEQLDFRQTLLSISEQLNEPNLTDVDRNKLQAQYQSIARQLNQG